MGGDQCGALVLRKAEAHRQLVSAECHIDDPAHPKLDLIPDQRLLGPRQRQRNGPDVIWGHHCATINSSGHLLDDKIVELRDARTTRLVGRHN